MSETNQPQGQGDAPGTGEAPAAPKTTFADLGLRPEVLRAVTDMGFNEPMAVQAATVPAVRAGRDLMVQSRTGSGKTAAFGIPLVDGVVKGDDKFVQAIILLPTRELALQVAAELARIAAHSDITVVPVYGGAPMGRQIEMLKAGGQIVCGTPGRVLDHLRRGTLKLDRVRCAVLDECDEMLSMGFQEDIEAILDKTPTDRQTLLFSATVPEGIQRLSRRYLKNPENLKLSADFVGVHEIRHVYYSIPGGQREQELLRIIQFENPERAIIFCNTREETGRVAEFLRRQGMEAAAISSDLSQSEREEVMGRMRAGQIRFMVATDVAARGIDLENLPCVFNYTFPDSPEVYIHRTGRTGRAGKHGTAISMIGPTEVGPFYYVKLLYKIKPEERSLPSEAEIRSKREGERILALRSLFPGEASAEWRALARRLLVAVDGEQVVAALLEKVLSGQTSASVAPPPRAVEAPRPRIDEPRRERPERGDRGERGFGERPYGDRDRGGYRDRERGRFEGRRERGRRPEREGERTERNGHREERPESIAQPARTEGTEVFGGERTEGAARTEATERPPRTEATERPARTEATERPARTEATERTARTEPTDRVGQTDATERPVRTEPAERVEQRLPRRERGERTDRGERGFRGDRLERGDRPERTERRERGDEPPAPPVAPKAEPRGGESDYFSVWNEAPTDGGEAAAPPPRRAPAPPPAEDDAGSDEARLFLNLGRKDGASPEDVAALLSDAGAAVPPGNIDVMNTHSYINVPSGDAGRLCDALSGREHNGRRLLCEPARPRRR